MPYDYEQIANEIAGPDAREDVRAAALALHGGEPLHMHEGISSKEPCSYCWLRAGRAVKALRLLAEVRTAKAAKETADTDNPVLFCGVPAPKGLDDEPWDGTEGDSHNPELSCWRWGVESALQVHAPQRLKLREQVCPVDVRYPYEHREHLWVSGREAVQCPGKPMAAAPTKED